MPKPSKTNHPRLSVRYDSGSAGYVVSFCRLLVFFFFFSFFVWQKRRHSGGYSVRVPPLPIPNREVKPDRADGTASQWESRSLPYYRRIGRREDRRVLLSSLFFSPWRCIFFPLPRDPIPGHAATLFFGYLDLFLFLFGPAKIYA